MRRSKQDSQQTRDDLLHAALTVFDEFGVSRASLQQIAQSAGVTRGALYWHFKNKEDLFDALCEKMLSELDKNLTKRGFHGDSWRAFRDDSLLFFHYLLENQDAQKFLRILHTKLEHTEENRAIRLIWEKYVILHEKQFYQVLAQARINGELPANMDTSEVLAAVSAVKYGLIGSWLLRPDFDLIKTGRIVLNGVLKELQTQP
ncbi:MAG: TetR family transcriptional regulator [Neisseria sp.]|nr:TetR family transcriptional regulator [Neisseria sp.]